MRPANLISAYRGEVEKGADYEEIAAMCLRERKFDTPNGRHSRI